MKIMLSKAKGREALHATSFTHRGGRCSRPLPLRSILAVLLVLCASMLPAQSRWCEICYPAANTGLVKGDFTLTYYSDDGTTVTPVSTTAITVAQTALGTTGKACYRFKGLSDSNTITHHLIAMVTSTSYVQGCRIPWSGASQAVAWTSSMQIPAQGRTFKQYDTKYPLELDVLSGFSADPTGLPVTCSCKQMGVTGTKFLRQTASAINGIADPATGTWGVSLVYSWGATDLNTVGTFNCEFELTIDGGRMTLPQDKPLQIQVVASIAGP